MFSSELSEMLGISLNSEGREIHERSLVYKHFGPTALFRQTPKRAAEFATKVRLVMSRGCCRPFHGLTI
ncbi:MAG: hypothetical protein AUI36_13560 [Cyanobacteria bacterium 13_1_40CM_2_61_4]|nr:MAG: hypothetical protein AUI36_13560 [Cyanobacteria bacterium 13_1_40CM_2_61_4]